MFRAPEKWLSDLNFIGFGPELLLALGSGEVWEREFYGFSIYMNSENYGVNSENLFLSRPLLILAREFPGINIKFCWLMGSHPGCY